MRRDFKGRHFEGEVILWAVRRYRRYGVSYRELAGMPAERGVAVDHTTIYRRVRRYAPEIEARLRRIWRTSSLRRNRRVDETQILSANYTVTCSGAWSPASRELEG